MGLTFDQSPVDIHEWEREVSMTEERLQALWGIHVGTSSQRSSGVRVHPACTASAQWLHTLWGFSI